MDFKTLLLQSGLYLIISTFNTFEDSKNSISFPPGAFGHWMQMTNQKLAPFIFKIIKLIINFLFLNGEEHF